MDIIQEILSNINERYVLLKKEDEFLIIDSKRRTMVLIDDPIINLSNLIDTMKERGVEVYTNISDLPQATETLITDNKFPESYKLFIKKIYDKDGHETGSIISALTNKRIDFSEKKVIEERIQDYAHTVIYPDKGLSIFSEVYSDIASIVIIKGINNLPYQFIDSDYNNNDIEQTEIYNW